MIDPRKVCLYIPPGLKKFKLDLFERIGAKIGRVVRNDPALLDELPPEVIPIVGCTPALRPWIEKWQASRRKWIYWDRGYARRVFATWLPRGSDLGIPGGYYRWHVGQFQMTALRDVPGDRWAALRTEARPWRRGGRQIVVIDTLPDYWLQRGIENWAVDTAAKLRTLTDRPIIVRAKESKVPLYDELRDAHALVSHGSIAAVESVIMGCPVFVDRSCAAALVGLTDLAKIEAPIYPGREQWLHSLAYCQFNERELVDGTLWRLIE